MSSQCEGWDLCIYFFIALRKQYILTKNSCYTCWLSVNILVSLFESQFPFEKVFLCITDSSVVMVRDLVSLIYIFLPVTRIFIQRNSLVRSSALQLGLNTENSENCDITCLVRNCSLYILSGCLWKETVSPAAECGNKIKYFNLFNKRFLPVILQIRSWKKTSC